MPIIEPTHRDAPRRDPTFVDVLMPEELGRNKRLDRIDEMLDWDPVARLVSEIHSLRRGAPSYRPLTMVKVLLLEQWYTLSDPEMEEALDDRLSFRRFVGLGIDDGTPDHSTISRFRSKLGKDRSAELFEEINGQLAGHGMMVKEGTLMDATLVEAQVRRPSREQGRGAKSSLDSDADWSYSQRGSQTHFGYKVHIGVDEGSRPDPYFIRLANEYRRKLTPAKVYESEVADQLLSGDENAVYADRAYESKQRRKRLREQGVKDRIMHRSHKHQRELPYWQKRRNELIEPIRRSSGEGIRDVEAQLRVPPGCATGGWSATRWRCCSRRWPTTSGGPTG